MDHTTEKIGEQSIGGSVPSSDLSDPESAKFNGAIHNPNAAEYCSEVEYVKFRSYRKNKSSRERPDDCGPGNKLRSVKSPDMMQRSGSESSNFESIAESRSSLNYPKLPISSTSISGYIPALSPTADNIKTVVNGKSSDPNCNFEGDSLPNSRFTCRASSHAFGYPSHALNLKKSLIRQPGACISTETAVSGGCGPHETERRNTLFHSATANVGSFEDRVGSSYPSFCGQRGNSSESSMGRFLEDVTGRQDFGLQSFSSFSCRASDPNSSSVIGVTSYGGGNLGCQQVHPPPISFLAYERDTCEFVERLPGRHDVRPSDPENSQSRVESYYSTCLNLAEVLPRSCHNRFSPPMMVNQTVAVKMDPECNPVIPEVSNPRSNVVISHGSQIQESTLPNLAPVACDVQCEQMRSDQVVTGTSETDSIGRGNRPAFSRTPVGRQTSMSSSGRVQSNQSYLEINAGSSNKDSSNSAGVGPSEHIDPSSSLERQINSHDSGMVIMSLVHKKNKIAGSSYNLSTGQVHLLESVSENFEFRTAILALRSATPSTVIVPSAGATRFVKELKTKLEGDVHLKDCLFQCLSPRYFAYGFARRTVLESSLWEGCLTFRSEDAKKSAIVSSVNFNDERLVCAFGGLLYHLSTGSPQLGAGTSPSPIISVQHIKLSNKLWVDTESFRNLQIFDPVEHPSSFNWSCTNRDDGKSMFSLFERFCSSVGLTKLKSFLANPVNCQKVLEKRHEVIDFYLNDRNFNAVEALRSFASQMSSSSIIMNYLSSPTLRGGHWKHIYRHIYYTVSYAEVCRCEGDQSELFRELGGTIVDAVYSMAHNLERVVDLVNMENNETFVIKYGFHPPLDAAKEKFSRLKIAMDKVTPHEFDSVPPFITRIQMMYIPEMKFLLSVPYWAPDLSKEDLVLPNLEFKFSANKTAFYKSRRCYELDELLGDAQTDIIHEESMIIQSLRNYLKKHLHHIVGMTQKISEIECIFALAKVAREERYAKPEIIGSCIMDIRGGWHPLLDVPSTQIIANDMISSPESSLVKLIYGPNASGKSIYLKQIGLIMYLVHVGSFVPAASAKVGLFSRILARTTKEESVISMSSSMLSELKKLQDSVLDSSKGSLIILDEIGKGSIEMNCIAVVSSALNHFLSLGSDSPHVLVSTHLSGISEFVTSPPHTDDGRNLFDVLSMDYTVTEGDIVFLYQVRRGRPDGSYVFQVLENSELATPIVKTARSVLEALRTGDNFLPYCETRIQRSHKYLNFIRKFINIDMAKPGYLEKLQNKIQRYYEKPSY